MNIFCFWVMSIKMFWRILLWLLLPLFVTFLLTRLFWPKYLELRVGCQQRILFSHYLPTVFGIKQQNFSAPAMGNLTWKHSTKKAFLFHIFLKLRKCWSLCQVARYSIIVVSAVKFWPESVFLMPTFTGDLFNLPAVLS